MACRMMFQASGSAPASTVTAAAAAARSSPEEAAMAGWLRAAALNAGSSVIFWKPAAAMAKAMIAQAVTAREPRMRSGMVLPPGGLR